MCFGGYAESLSRNFANSGPDIETAVTIGARCRARRRRGRFAVPGPVRAAPRAVAASRVAALPGLVPHEVELLACLVLRGPLTQVEGRVREAGLLQFAPQV